METQRTYSIVNKISGAVVQGGFPTPEAAAAELQTARETQVDVSELAIADGVTLELIEPTPAATQPAATDAAPAQAAPTHEDLGDDGEPTPPPEATEVEPAKQAAKPEPTAEEKAAREHKRQLQLVAARERRRAVKIVEDNLSARGPTKGARAKIVELIKTDGRKLRGKR